jgi:hypothetical protein
VIHVSLASENPCLIVAVLEGRVVLSEVESDRRFGELVKSFKGAPFRVLCDFRATTSMAEGVADAFMRAQSFALKANLEKDAYVTSDVQLRYQLNRIAHDTRRFHWLGPLRFFDTIEAAQSYIRA